MSDFLLKLNGAVIGRLPLIPKVPDIAHAFADEVNPDFIDALARAKDFRLRSIAASSPVLSYESMLLLAVDPAAVVRMDLLQNAVINNIAAAPVLNLISGNDPTLREVVESNNPSWCKPRQGPIPPDQLSLVYDNEETPVQPRILRCFNAMNPITDETQQILVAHKDCTIRSYLADNESINANSVDALLEDPSSDVRHTLLENRRAFAMMSTDQLLRLCAEDPDMIETTLTQCGEYPEKLTPELLGAFMTIAEKLGEVRLAAFIQAGAAEYC